MARKVDPDDLYNDRGVVSGGLKDYTKEDIKSDIQHFESKGDYVNASSIILVIGIIVSILLFLGSFPFFAVRSTAIGFAIMVSSVVSFTLFFAISKILYHLESIDRKLNSKD